MAVEKNKFFREITRRICGSLDIEKALEETFLFLRIHVPADAIGLGFSDEDVGHIHILAKCAQIGERYIWEDRESKITLSDRQKKHLQQSMAEDRPIIIANRPGDQPKTRLEIFPQLETHSALFFRMNIRGQGVGTLLISAKGPDRYTPDHVVLVKSVQEPFAMAMINARRYRELEKIKTHLEEDNRALLTEMNQAMGNEVIGADSGLKKVMEHVRAIARSDSPALLLGETGTGKEVIANAIHKASPRKNGPLISMQCGAIPETLLDSELFGHEKGAFTGALERKRGRFERADGGTLFLDEIGELSAEAQVKLLRVLQERRFERVGGTRTLQVDVRVVAATHRNLEEMVSQGSFREDLWYRLNVLPIHIPPLRFRREDVPVLIRYFVSRKAREMNLVTVPALRDRDLERLKRYDWPGNVRELQNIVERALILSRGDYLFFPEVTKSAGPFPAPAPADPVPADTRLSLDAAMARHIRAVLDQVYWQVAGTGGAAEILEMKPSTLRFRMKKLGIVKQKAVKPAGP